jgi:hypothetical protein
MIKGKSPSRSSKSLTINKKVALNLVNDSVNTVQNVLEGKIAKLQDQHQEVLEDHENKINHLLDFEEATLRDSTDYVKIPQV